MKYEIIDNKGKIHEIQANNDREALDYMKTRYIDYIYSVLSTDAIILIRPNGYILAYIDTATGMQTIKRMEDWI